VKENTGEILFKDDEPKWFIQISEQLKGPFRSSEIYSQVKKGELSILDYIWKQGLADWQKISDCEEFKVSAPEKPKMDPATLMQSIPQVKKAEGRGAPPFPGSAQEASSELREWFLFYSQTQYGPFSFAEVQRLLTVGQITLQTFAWKSGLAEWVAIDKIPEFKINLQQQPPMPPASETTQTKTMKLENRIAPRKPLVARFLLTDENTIISGMCRDVSSGGMQVLTDKVPGGPGTKIKINVSPDSNSEMQDAFAAEGVIVRVLEDFRGFSFRFTRIQADAQKIIEKYTKNE